MMPQFLVAAIIAKRVLTEPSDKPESSVSPIATVPRRGAAVGDRVAPAAGLRKGRLPAYGCPFAARQGDCAPGLGRCQSGWSAPRLLCPSLPPGWP